MFVSTGKKYPYFPKYEMKGRLTPFRSYQVDYPDLYKNYKGEDSIIRIDCLQGVSDYLPVEGDSRNRVYLLLSGDCSDEEMQQLLTRYYKTHKPFQNHVDEIFMVKPDKLLTGIIRPMRELISQYTTQMESYMKANDGKYLMLTHDYLYYRTSFIPSIPGVEVIKE